jgi:hypothetical protein
MKQTARKILTRIGLVGNYLPQITTQVDAKKYLEEIQNFFNLSDQEVLDKYDQYLSFSESKGYKNILGETKTLCVEEAFLIYLAAQITKPRTFCEIGTQYGKSTRRILDIFNELTLHPTSYCFDITKEIKFITDDEVEFRLHDLTNDFEHEVLETLSPELIFLDAHPYALLKTIIRGFVNWSCTIPAILAVHDCSPGLYRSKMPIPKDRPSSISSHSGLWERHVLAEIFQVQNEQLDDLKTQSHHLKIFSTPHGLALIAPKTLLGMAEERQ